MGRRIIALAVGSLLATTGWTAERAAKEEAIGLGTGAAIGAAAGGPLGFIIGAGFGGWLGDRFHEEKSGRLTAESKHDEAEARAATLETRSRAEERRARRLEAELEQSRTAHRSELQQALALEVFFRTEESALPAETERRLAQLAQFVTPMDGALIHLEGHADGRGEEQYNAELSAARASAVRDALMRGGLPAERIIVHAAGETGAAAQDADGMALERRVQMRIVDIDGEINRVAQRE